MKSKYLKQQIKPREVYTGAEEDTPTFQKRLDEKVKLNIDEMFYSIQTEGVLAGRPAYFVRLFGCNLGSKQCPWCDTQQQTKPKKMSTRKVLKKISKECVSYTVVVTGGEVFLQDIVPLVSGIIRSGRTVQLETNGTISLPDFPFIPPNNAYKSGLVIVCSPKTKRIHEDIAKNAVCFKYVIKAGMQGKDGLPKGLFRPTYKQRIMISPCFEKSQKKTDENIAETVRICKQYGYYLSLQTHRWLGIR